MRSRPWLALGFRVSERTDALAHLLGPFFTVALEPIPNLLIGSADRLVLFTRTAPMTSVFHKAPYFSRAVRSYQEKSLLYSCEQLRID